MQGLEDCGTRRFTQRGASWYAFIMPYALDGRQQEFNQGFLHASAAGNLAKCAALVRAHGHVHPVCGGVVLNNVVAHGRTNQEAVVKWLVRECGVNVHSHDDFPFRRACESAQWSLAHVLLALDPDCGAWPADAMDHLKLWSWSTSRIAWMRVVVRRCADTRPQCTHIP